MRFLLFSLAGFLLFAGCTPASQQVQTPLEAHRPAYHFTPPSKWMNDPNGMVFYEGEYHLFYQYYPDSTVWGPMHWGHAVSKNLVDWQHLPIALYPDSLGMIFSGSAVVDWNNTSGFGVKGVPPLVAIFTQHYMPGEKAGRHDFQYQSIAYSNDKGRTWKKYAQNPVIPNTDKIHDFRDPKVSWHAPSKQWVMTFAAKDRIKFWTSPDLKKWQFQSDFGQNIGAHGGVWECPDFFKLRVEGTDEEKYVLLTSMNPGAPNGGSGTQYFIGDFDGKQFVLDKEFAAALGKGQGVWLDFGRDNYAGVTWSDVPAADGRRLFIGWMSNWDYAQAVPTQAWRSALTVPRTLTLHKTATGYKIFSKPVKELERLRGVSFGLSNKPLDKPIDLSSGRKINATLTELRLDFTIPTGAQTEVTLVLSNAQGETYRVGYDAAKKAYFSDRTKAGKSSFSDKFATKIHYAPTENASGKYQMHVFFDRASCELFADDGETVMTDIFFPNTDFTDLNIVASNGAAVLDKVVVYGLK
jgi:fructan beta-fructosidase